MSTRQDAWRADKALSDNGPETLLERLLSTARRPGMPADAVLVMHEAADKLRRMTNPTPPLGHKEMGG